MRTAVEVGRVGYDGSAVTPEPAHHLRHRRPAKLLVRRAKDINIVGDCRQTWQARVEEEGDKDAPGRGD